MAYKPKMQSFTNHSIYITPIRVLNFNFIIIN
jgi:hypothetical protein